ncbi:MAG: hypothetical protein K8T10_11690 [Candidatus Eremiobacteraeota bacterium]|nr:hypothetical protein [Candidatus Eremiobacteraeota bacterium]
MFDRIYNIMSQVFIYGLSVKLSHENNGREIKLKLKNFLIKDQEINGIIIENLHLSMENLPDMDTHISFDDASFIVEKLDFFISEDWINKIIESEDSLKNHELEDLRIDFYHDKLSISGKIRVGILFPFSVDLNLAIDNGKIKIIFGKFRAGNLITLPKWLQKALLSIAKNYLESKNMLESGVILTDEYILIDHLSFIPLDCYLKFDKIFTEEKYLIIRGGEDKDKCLKIIDEKLKKKLKKKKEEMEKIRFKEIDAKKKEKKPIRIKKDDKVTRILDEIIQKAGEMKRLRPAKPADMSNSRVKLYVDGEPSEYQEESQSTGESHKND